MPNTLLVVDGRGHPRPLTERLGALGYVCLYARGPLRARTLLSQHTVDLILWKDNTGNGDLSAELLEEWGRHPDIPVVRLFGRGAAAPEGMASGALDEVIAANLPAEVPEYQLFTTLSRCLIRTPGPTGGLPGNELAFRHAITTLRTHPEARMVARAEMAIDPNASETVVSDRERALLRDPAIRGPDRGVTLINPWRWVWNRWVGGRRARSAS